MPTAHARACLLASSQPIRSPHPCSSFRPIPVGISRSLEAQFDSPLNPLRLTHSHSLVVHTCYICTSATMMSGCRKHASTALMEDFFRLQKDQEKTDFPTGAYAKITRRLLMPASCTCNLLPLAPEPLLYFACLSYIFVTESFHPGRLDVQSTTRVFCRIGNMVQQQ